jgi:hypothetical protein
MREQCRQRRYIDLAGFRGVAAEAHNSMVEINAED